LLDYRITSKDNLPDTYTLKNLDTINEPLKMNIITRSQVFAPYGSGISQKEQQQSNEGFQMDKNLVVLNKALKFNPMVIDVNKQYEHNNNGETEGLPVNANQQDSFNLESSLYRDDQNEKQKQKSMSPLKMMLKLNQKEKDVKSTQLDLSKDPTMTNLNESLIKQVEEIGYSRDYIITCLRNNESNYCTASYYLLMKQFDKF
jgi:hypothetical protein